MKKITYKDLDLSLRIENDFPHQMISFSEKRDHCLITGLQFLGLYFDCIKNIDKKDELIEEFINCVGVFKKYKDWNTYIETT